MNVNPSDTDVRQGYSLAESGASAAAVSATQTGDTSQKSSAVAAGTTQSAQSDVSPQPVETDARSKAAQTNADKASAKEAAAKLGQQFQESDTGLTIRVLDDSQHTIQVEIVDKKSNKVLRQIPQDEMLKLSASMKEMTGVLLNKPA